MARNYFVHRGDNQRTIVSPMAELSGSTFGAFATGHPARRKPYVPMLRSPSHISTITAIAACGLVRDVVPTTVLIARADELEAAIILDRKNQWHSLQSDRRCHAWSCCSGRAISHTSEICDKYGILPIADEVMTDWAEPAPHLV